MMTPTKNPESPHESTPLKDKGLWRDLVAYWILGLCNNYGYVVMLSAAHDILKAADESHHPSNSSTISNSTIIDPTKRECNELSTGAILLADILPALIIKFTAPFLPFFVHVRILICCLAAAAGFILVAFSQGNWLAILGVIATSFSSGLGEVTFLAHSSRYNKNVISTWSSGTGGAGIVGAVSYAGLTGLGLDPVTTLLVMLVVPVLEGLTFWVLLRKPHEEDQPVQTATGMSVYGSSAATFGDNEQNQKAFGDLKSKFKAIPLLFKYMIPLLLVYLLEYFINQGLFELLYFEGAFLDKDEQYRWLQVDYQIGVFISRSSVNLLQLKQVWIMSVFQFINVLVLLFQVLYGYIPNIWIVFAIVLWEGLLGGGAYVNTFYRMSHEIPMEKQKFSMSITAIADSLGIALAGWIAMPTHNALCALPKPT